MDTINILWTGGWDSTYRVLELLVIENHAVRPYYIVDPGRRSIANEIIAMTRIRHRIQTTFPTQAARFLPVEMVHLEAIQPDEEITGWVRQLASKTHVGSQYDWLARFAKYNATELEVCIVKFTPVHTGLFGDYIVPLLRGKGHSCRIEGPLSEPALELFTYFRFPTIHLTKGDIRVISEEQGFMDIMKLTWFCHDPQKGLPCGRCRPCELAPASGLKCTFYQPTIWDRIEGVVKRLHK
jgi:hypothetical protein